MLLLTESFKWPSSTADLGLMWINDQPTIFTLSSTGSRNGTKCLSLANVNTASVTKANHIMRKLRKPISGTVVRVAFWIRLSAGWTGVAGLTNSEFLWSLKNVRNGTSDAPNLSVSLSATGQVEVYKLDTLTSNGRDLVATGTIALNDNAWHRLEFELNVTTTGSAKVWVDSTLDINVSGVDMTDVAAPVDLSYLRYFALSTGQPAPAAGETVLIDEVVVWDDSSGFTGEMTPKDHRIDFILPAADGSTNSWTRNTGATNASAVDDPASATHDGDTTYVESTSTPQTDLYDFSAMAIYPDAIRTVCLKTVHGAPSGKFGHHRGICKSGATTANGDKHKTIDGGYTLSEDVFDVDPNTSAAWTLANLNAAQFGVERVAP